MKIMIVDDDDEFCELAMTYFLNREFEITTVDDGNIALKAVAELQPDIVILDIDLGSHSIDGWKLCSYLKETDRYINLQMGIILISGVYVEREQQNEGLNGGAGHYLVRPFHMEDLLTRVNSLGRTLNKTEPAIDSVDLANGLSINFPRYEVTLLDKLIDLNKPEFDVLALLASKPGVYFTSQQIIEAVWPFDLESPDKAVKDGTLTGCIYDLRQKLDAKNTDLYIKSKRTIGYMLNDRDPVA